MLLSLYFLQRNSFHEYQIFLRNFCWGLKYENFGYLRLAGYLNEVLSLMRNSAAEYGVSSGGITFLGTVGSLKLHWKFAFLLLNLVTKN